MTDGRSASLKKSPPALMDKPGAPWFERREERSEGQPCTSCLYHQNRRTRKNPEEQAEFYQFLPLIYLFIHFYQNGPGQES
jgi:hypothetical protein